MFERAQVGALVERLAEEPRRIQMVFGPRQTGKTTIIRQALGRTHLRSHYCAVEGGGLPPDSISPAGIPTPGAIRDGSSLAECWREARLAAEEFRGGFVLAFDEIQRIPRWSEIVKALWDEDRLRRCPLRIVLSGSTPLALQQDLGESLHGRFEMIDTVAWSFAEMEAAFGLEVDRFVFFGGYPGAVPDQRTPPRWRRYVRGAIVNASIERDLLAMTRVDRPALLTRLFALSARFSGQILSWNKMLGELRDRGNTTTLARYLDLLERIGLVAGLTRYSGALPLRPASPKLQVLDTSFMTFDAGYEFEEAKRDRTFWGRLVESAVGAHLLNTVEVGERVHYWREGPDEVDFVLHRGPKLAAIEVKTGRDRSGRRGLAAFRQRFPSARAVLVGPGGVPLEGFLSVPAGYWVKAE